jgi:stage II sporulation protein D
LASSSSSATTAAELRIAALVAALLAAACAPPEIGRGATPASVIPEIRVGVVPEAASVSAGGGGALVISGSDGAGLLTVPAGAAAMVSSGRLGLLIKIGAGSEPTLAGASATVTAVDSGGSIRFQGRDYRGKGILFATPTGVMAVNVVGMEDYLLGVVGAEMGRRTEQDIAALRAQAVVSRTVATRRLGQWRTRGFDILATVADQAYAGVAFEGPASNEAVAETRGELLSYQGQIIDAFFHSTCAGRTADGTEVFAGADRPYLRSIRDEDDSGSAWCAISPRYRWQESWTGEALARTLRQTLPLAGGTAALAGRVSDVRVLDRTATGRVAHVEFVGLGTSLTVTGPVARLVLRGADGSILRSANFNLQVTRNGGRIVRLDAVGAGAGHGVGMCQWGALGRARAGFSYREILSAYFPGTEVTRTY